MPTFYFPKLTSDNYETFRGLTKFSMPQTFAQWEQQQTSKKDEHHLYWSRYGVCVDVEITPNEFKQFCATTGYSCTQQALERLAFEKGASKH